MNKNYKNISDKKNLEKEILEFWKKNNIFDKSIKNRKNSPNFNFYEGPPSANGLPGIHHAISRTIKDVFCRYKTMQGYRVERKAGWDAHGLPIELAAEKKLKIKKDDIGEKISIEKYNETCKSIVFENKESWDLLTEKLGYWLDTKDPYITCSNEYIESVWHVFKEIYEKNLIYKGYSIQPYSPAAGTGLSSHELNQQGCYKTVKDTSVTAQFKLKRSKDEFILAWTTTPWTLPANAALAVGKNIDYVKIKTFNRYTGEKILCILAKDCLKNYFSENFENKNNYKLGNKDVPWEIIDKFSGESLVGERYEQLMPYIEGKEENFKIIEDDFVTTTDGTGIVHIAPTFGADDMRAAQKKNIPGIFVKDKSGEDIPIVNKQGQFIKEISDFAERYVKKEYEPENDLKNENYKSVDEDIAIKLKKENKAFLVQKYEHSYPHCWRTDKPILYYPLNAWFIETTKIKKKLIDLNKKINWIPSNIGEKRFGNWLENIVDWNVSRDRFWGTPLPIWSTKNKKEIRCIGSVKELKNEIKKSLQAKIMQENPLDKNKINLHRPFIDNIILVSKSGEPMYKETDILDVWFDSGAMPYTKNYYPFKDKNSLKNNFPADLIAEGVDQTRGWFFTLHVISAILMNDIAFKNCFVNGLILDKNGLKMSKRLGNTIDPFKVIEEEGADALRWHLLLNFNISDSIKFDSNGVRETYNKFFGTLENVYKFFQVYANIDSYQAKKISSTENLSIIDKWIISKLNSTLKKVIESYESYDTKNVTQTIQNFIIDDLSNWYIRLNRKRFWQSKMNQEKKNAYDILFTVILKIAKAIAPIAPFYSEAIFKSIESNLESVHLENFPNSEVLFLDITLEKKMDLIQKISSLIHSMRKKEKIKVRQPLSCVEIEIFNPEKENYIKDLQNLILEETNIKKIFFCNKKKNNNITIKPNFSYINSSIDKNLIKEVITKINSLNDENKNTLINEGFIEITLSNGETKRLNENFFLISQNKKQGELSATFGEIKVTLNTQITEDLYKEGLAREIVNKIQNLRKEKGFQITDKIFLKISSKHNIILKAIQKNSEYIKTETQTISLSFIENFCENEIVIDNISFFIDIKKCIND